MRDFTIVSTTCVPKQRRQHNQCAHLSLSLSLSIYIYTYILCIYIIVYIMCMYVCICIYIYIYTHIHTYLVIHVAEPTIVDGPSSPEWNSFRMISTQERRISFLLNSLLLCFCLWIMCSCFISVDYMLLFCSGWSRRRRGGSPIDYVVFTMFSSSSINTNHYYIHD